MRTDFSEVWAKVEEFRTTWPTLACDKIPLDMVEFVELDLGFTPLAWDHLDSDFRAEAALSVDFKELYIDGWIYDRIESLTKVDEARLRFSLAHEIGHFFLHRTALEKSDLSSPTLYLHWLNKHGGQKYEIEQEANEFAGRLLVPLDCLQDLYDKAVEGFDSKYGRHQWQDNASLRSQLAAAIAPRFGVNPKVIEVRLDREGLWPDVVG